MTPKEKAKKILNQHTKALFNTGLKINKELVRTSALLCVEQQKELLANIKTEDCWEWEDYYDEVKNELKQL